MPKSGYVARDLALTQAGETALCDVCAGVGAVLAHRVNDGKCVTMVAVNGGEPKRQYVNNLAPALIPCPGCFKNGGLTVWTPDAQPQS